MRPVLRGIGALALAGFWLSAPAASAAISTFLAPVAISPEALAAEPALANYHTLDLRVNIDPGFDWASTGFDLQLTRGSFYNSPLGSTFPSPQLWDIFPQLMFDTFITQAADPDVPATFVGPIINSAFPELPIRPHVFTDMHISVNYASTSLVRSGPGTFTVARFTLTDDAFGPIFGRSTQIHRTNFGLQITPFEFVVPEPSGLACSAIMSVGVAGRRRPRC